MRERQETRLRVHCLGRVREVKLTTTIKGLNVRARNVRKVGEYAEVCERVFFLFFFSFFNRSYA
jgi:hypothetical protein